MCGLFIRKIPAITRHADIPISLLKLSLKISHPKVIPNIGVRNAKLATPDAG